MSWLKKAVINSQAPKLGVIDILRKNMGGYTEARSHKVIHASDITKPGFCPRHIALLDLMEQTKKNEYISTALQATFDIGHATAELVVEEWMGKNAIGNWRCLRCDKQHTMTSKPEPWGCTVNGKTGVQKHIWKYVEPSFVSKEYAVSGSLDVLADVGAKWLVTELKIINVDDFEKMLAPLPEHRIRTSLYLKLIADSDSPYKDMINLHEASVLYVSRGYGKKHAVHQEILPFKEYRVVRDDTSYVEPLKKAKQIKVYRDSVVSTALGPSSFLMPSGICHTALDKQAKVCTTCTACFSGKYISQQEPLI